MILKNIKISIRNLISQGGYTIINIFGLSVGIASALLIMLYVVNEKSFDKFHPNANNIYRLCTDYKLHGTEMCAPVSNGEIGPMGTERYPEIINYTRLFTFGGDPDMRYGDRVFVEKKFIYADSTFFQVFNGFQLLQGDPNNILKLPHQLVLTQSAAKRYFDNDDPIGQVLKAWQGAQSWEIVGVVQDPPANSHFKFDMMGSMATISASPAISGWANSNAYTYILTREGTDEQTLNQYFAEMTRENAYPIFMEFLDMTMEMLESEGNYYRYMAQPLTDIHLKSTMPFELDKNGNQSMVLVFFIIAIFILVIATINFINLATARSASRAKEVGIRKVAGSNRANLVSQFLTESMVLTGISVIVALVLLFPLIPVFNNITGKSMAIASLPIHSIILSLLGTILVVGLVAGSYPAFFLSGFKPLAVIKGKLSMGLRSSYLRGCLVVVQFLITIGLLIATFVVYGQISFLEKKDLGYNPNDVLVIDRPYIIQEQSINAFVDELKKLPNVKQVAKSQSLPTGLIGNAIVFKSRADEQDASNDQLGINVFSAHCDFDQTMQFEIIEGRFFDESLASDSMAIVVNQSAAKALGIDGSFIGRELRIMNQKRTLVGITNDFNYESLHQKVSPLAIIFSPNTQYIIVRMGAGSQSQTVAAIEAKWADFASEEPLNYYFLDQAVKQQYSDEVHASLLFTSFSLLAIIIALLGLWGLSSYTAERRRFEIGIRKVMGASVGSIVWLLLKETNRLVLIAAVIAIPIAWYVMKRWLENFAFRIDLSPWFFIGASVLAYMIAVATVSYRAFKAARTNPALSLQYE